MSWNIYVYAEVRSKNDNEWKPLTNGCVCDEFKFYDDGFYESLYTMKPCDSSHPIVKAVADKYSNFTFRYCYIKEVYNHYNSIIKKFTTELKTAYSALGVDSTIIDDPEYYESEEDDCNNDSLFRYMTFPVNKNLLIELVNSYNQYSKALKVIGMCDTITSMKENYDDVIRLSFVMM